MTHRDVAGVRAAAVARARWRLAERLRAARAVLVPVQRKTGAVSANLTVAICPRLQSQPSYLCRRHFAPLSGGKARVRFLYFACARAAQVGGMCRLGGGGLAGRKCARRAARGAPGVLCARSTSRMVVGQAPVAARGALRALKPRAAPWRRGEGSVARAYLLPRTLASRGQKDVGQLRFCQCQQFFLFAMVGMVWISHPTSGSVSAAGATICSYTSLSNLGQIWSNIFILR